MLDLTRDLPAHDSNTTSQHTATSQQEIFQTSRRGTGLVRCIVVSSFLSYLTHLPTYLLTQPPADLPLVFGTHFEFRANSTSLEYLTASAYQDTWVSFATDSSGALAYGGVNKTWPRYSPEGATTMVFGGNGQAAELREGGYADGFIDCSGPQQGPP